MPRWEEPGYAAAPLFREDRPKGLFVRQAAPHQPLDSNLTARKTSVIGEAVTKAKPPVAAAKAAVATPAASDTEATPSFEANIRELGGIVERLERGDLPLEASLELFEQGVRLARDAQARLDRAEKRVEQLLGFDDEGAPILEPMDPE